MLDFIYSIRREEGVSRLRLNVNRHNKARQFYDDGVRRHRVKKISISATAIL